MNYYERHLGDYAKDAGHLSMLEHGAYSLLLDRYYTTEQPIPAEQAHRICRARTRDERAAVDAVLAEFFVLKDGAWTNGRADREITKMQAKVRTAQENGKRGGRPRRTEIEPSRNPVGSESVTQTKALQSPDTNHQEESASALSARARVGRALIDAGIEAQTVNVSDPRVTALLDEGASPEEFGGVAREAVTKGKGVAWVYVTLAARRAEAKAMPKAGKHTGFQTKNYREGVGEDGTFAA